ncbi:MAG: serine hydrolase domain-containing protein [Pseudomonadota bacterium]|nr:serine hydrolase domain-containing protein [Pseudomonadota bacterium]
MSVSQSLQIEGFIEPKFESLQRAFNALFIEHGETGAAVAVYQNQKLVAHLYGTNQSPNGAWHKSHRVCTMSSSKGPLALCVLLLASRGKLNLDAPVAEYWPEFAQNGKGSITTRHILNHSAGLASIANTKPGDIFDWQTMTQALAAAKPRFAAGEALVYHALTYGHLLGEIICRVDGRMPNAFFQQEIAAPFGIDYALAHSDNQISRNIIPTKQFSPFVLKLMSRWLSKIPHWKWQFFKPCSEHYQPNSDLWRSSEIPAVTGQGTAEGLAKLYAILANKGSLNGKELFSQQWFDTTFKVPPARLEFISKVYWAMQNGFMFNAPDIFPIGPNKHAFGHFGMGGSFGFADLESGLAMAYVTEKYHEPSKHNNTLMGQRAESLINAMYQSI